MFVSDICGNVVMSELKGKRGVEYNLFIMWGAMGCTSV